MDVYLDNNIIISLEKNDYSIDFIKSLIASEKAKFFYSSAHIYEANNLRDFGNFTREYLLQKRFETIRTVCKKNYLYTTNGSNPIYNIIEDPQEVFETITMFPFGINAISSFVNLLPSSVKERCRFEMGIDPMKLNNYHPQEVIDQLTSKIQIGENKLSFIEIIERGIDDHPNGKNMGLYNRFAGVFELLDLFGYWKDKETGSSNVARLWDSMHAFYASYCDYFVCDDKRCRQKTEVVYNLYNRNTKIISTK